MKRWEKFVLNKVSRGHIKIFTYISAYLNSVLLVSTICLGKTSANAIKCLRAKNVEELKSDFPIVVRAKIVERKKIKSDILKFSLKIQVESVLKGTLELKVLQAHEVQYGKGLFQGYEVGKVYLFPIEKLGKSESYNVIVPSDGCIIWKD